MKLLSQFGMCKIVFIQLISNIVISHVINPPTHNNLFLLTSTTFELSLGNTTVFTYCIGTDIVDTFLVAKKDKSLEFQQA